MQTECSADLFGFAPVDGRKVMAGFDGGTMTSEAGAMLLGATDKQIRMIERFAGCFPDYRTADLVEHTVPRLVGQLVFRIALGYEDLIDHDQLRHDPVMAVLGGKLGGAARRLCAAGRQIEWTGGQANPRFVVTSPTREEHEARHHYEKLYCARGEMENRIKECQLDLYADRTSCHTLAHGLVGPVSQGRGDRL